MRSTRFMPRFLGIFTVGTVLLTGCSVPSGPEASGERSIAITAEGSRAIEYTSLDQLAAKANAIVEVEATGKTHGGPLPAGYANSGSAPTTYVTMKVTQVLSGEVTGGVIDVVSPGTVGETGEVALLDGGPYVLFLAPAMYAPNEPAGGYAVVGGPAGAFTEAPGTATFRHMDLETPRLPGSLDLATMVLPKINKTEGQLLAEGP